MRFLLCVMTVSLLVCVMDKSYVCSSLNHLLRVVFEMCLPCYHSNESSAVFDGCTDVLQYGKARNKVSVVDTKLVSKFLWFQELHQFRNHPLLIVNSTNTETGTSGISLLQNCQYWHNCQLCSAINLVCHSYLTPYAVADSGFARGRVLTLRGRQYTILPNFPKYCMKLKEFGSGGGGRHACLGPPLRYDMMLVNVMGIYDYLARGLPG